MAPRWNPGGPLKGDLEEEIRRVCWQRVRRKGILGARNGGAKAFGRLELRGANKGQPGRLSTELGQERRAV